MKKIVFSVSAVFAMAIIFVACDKNYEVKQIGNTCSYCQQSSNGGGGGGSNGTCSWNGTVYQLPTLISKVSLGNGIYQSSYSFQLSASQKNPNGATFSMPHVPSPANASYGNIVYFNLPNEAKYDITSIDWNNCTLYFTVTSQASTQLKFNVSADYAGFHSWFLVIPYDDNVHNIIIDNVDANGNGTLHVATK